MSKYYDIKNVDAYGLGIALKEAQTSVDEGGIPIGSALVHFDSTDPNGFPRLLGSGHNQRIQKSSSILHGEMAALEDSGRLKPEIYRKSTIYTTLSMCTGAILLYHIPRVVIGENSNFKGDEEVLRHRGVEVVVLDDAECKDLMKTFIREHPEEWNEDIGEVPL